MSTARTQTGFLDSEVLTRNMETSDFSFEELCGGNISIYLVLPPDKLETYARWLRLMVSIAIRAVARGPEDRGRSKDRSNRPSGAVRARRVWDDREAERGRAGLRPHGRAGDDHVGLRAGPQSTEARLPRPLGDVHRQFAGDDVLRRHGQFHGGVYQQDAGHLDGRAHERLNNRRHVGCAHRRNSPLCKSQRTSIQTSTSYSTQMMSRALLNPDEVRGLNARSVHHHGTLPADSRPADRVPRGLGSLALRAARSALSASPSRCAGGRCRDRLSRWVRSRGCSRSTATRSKRCGADDRKCSAYRKRKSRAQLCQRQRALAVDLHPGHGRRRFGVSEGTLSGGRRLEG